MESPPSTGVPVLRVYMFRYNRQIYHLYLLKQMWPIAPAGAVKIQILKHLVEEEEEEEEEEEKEEEEESV